MPKGPISLITNNFKIKSQNNHSGIIYTYTVDFIDGENLPTMPLPDTKPDTASGTSQASGDKPSSKSGSEQNPEIKTGSEESKNPGVSALTKPASVVRNFNVNNLETFQKYKILGAPAQAQKLKSIFFNYVCVGDNIFSTTPVEEKIDFETKTPFFGRKFTILIQRVSEFALDELN